MSSKLWVLIEFYEETVLFTTVDVVNQDEVLYNNTNIKPGNIVYVHINNQNTSRKVQILRISDNKLYIMEQKETLESQSKDLQDLLKACIETILHAKDKTNANVLLNSQVRRSPSLSPPRATTTNLDGSTSSLLQNLTTDLNKLLSKYHGTRNTMTETDRKIYDILMASKVVSSPHPDTTNSSSSSEAQDRLYYLQPIRNEMVPPELHGIMAIRGISSSTEVKVHKLIREGNKETSQGCDQFHPIDNHRESNVDPIQEIREDPLHRSTPLPTNDACALQNNTLHVDKESQTWNQLRSSLLNSVSEAEAAIIGVRKQLHTSVKMFININNNPSNLNLPESKLSITPCEPSPKHYHTNFERSPETTTSIFNQTGPSRIVEENPVAQIQATSTRAAQNVRKRAGQIQNFKRHAQQAGPSRIVEENPVAQIQATSTKTAQDVQILHRKRTAQQAGPSRIVEENPVAQIMNHETSTRPTANMVRYSGPLTRNMGDLQTQDTDMVAIGDGNAKVPKRVLDSIDWTLHTTATRQLLQALFPRCILATHSLTGKKSPAFMNRPAKKILDPKIVEDIVKIVSTRCGVPKNLVRNSITIKCTDEAKLYRNRQLKIQKRKKNQNDENRPPSSPVSNDSQHKN